MPKFKVSVEEICTYEIEVEADTEYEAKDIALETMVQDSNINRFFVSCDEREVSNIETIQ
jgi:hypothetical protein